MKKSFKTLFVAIGLVLLMPGISGRAQVYADSSTQLDKYLVPVTTPTAAPDAQGFLGRWLLLEPISKPNRSNTVFTDSYIREVFGVEYFKGQLGDVLPKDGAKVKMTVEYQPPVNLQGGRPMGFGMEPPKYEQKKVTLKKGRNVIWGAVINGPGMSDFCARFIDEAGKPVKNITLSTK